MCIKTFTKPCFCLFVVRPYAILIVRPESVCYAGDFNNHLSIIIWKGVASMDFRIEDTRKKAVPKLKELIKDGIVSLEDVTGDE